MSVSVYSGYDPTDEVSPNHSQPEYHVESPDVHSQSTQTGSLGVHDHHSSANLEPVSSPVDDLTNHMGTGDETTCQATPVSDVITQNVTLEPVSNDDLQPNHQATDDHRDELTTLTMTTSATIGTGQSERQVTAVTNNEPATRGRQAVGESEGGLAVIPKLTVGDKSSEGDTVKQKKHRSHSKERISDNVSSVDTRRLRAKAKPDEHVVKFGNMLDHCCSEGSDAEMSTKVKPDVMKPVGVMAKNGSNVKDKQSATGNVYTSILASFPLSLPREMRHVLVVH